MKDHRTPRLEPPSLVLIYIYKAQGRCFRTQVEGRVWDWVVGLDHRPVEMVVEVLGVLVEREEDNVIYGHAALRRDVAHHGNHSNIKCIFDYLHTLY